MNYVLREKTDDKWGARYIGVDSETPSISQVCVLAIPYRTKNKPLMTLLGFETQGDAKTFAATRSIGNKSLSPVSVAAFNATIDQLRESKKYANAFFKVLPVEKFYPNNNKAEVIKTSDINI